LWDRLPFVQFVCPGHACPEREPGLIFSVSGVVLTGPFKWTKLPMLRKEHYYRFDLNVSPIRSSDNPIAPVNFEFSLEGDEGSFVLGQKASNATFRLIFGQLQPGLHNVAVFLHDNLGAMLAEETSFVVAGFPRHSEFVLTPVTKTRGAVEGKGSGTFLSWVLQAPSRDSTSVGGDSFAAFIQKMGLEVQIGKNAFYNAGAVIPVQASDVGDGTYRLTGFVPDVEAGTFKLKIKHDYTAYRGRLQSPRATRSPVFLTLPISKSGGLIARDVAVGAEPVIIQAGSDSGFKDEPECTDVNAPGRWQFDTFVPYLCRHSTVSPQEWEGLLAHQEILWAGDSVMWHICRVLPTFLNMENLVLVTERKRAPGISGIIPSRITLDPLRSNIRSTFHSAYGLWTFQNWTVSSIHRSFGTNLSKLVLNSGLHDAGWLSYPAFERELRYTVSLFRRAYPDAKIVWILAPLPHGSVRGYDYHHTPERVHRVNAIAKRVLPRIGQGVTVLDLEHMTEAYSDMMFVDNYVHPSTRFLTIIYDLLAKALASA